MSKFRIPGRLRAEFMAHMDAHDFDEMSDGAWFATLERAGEDFLERHKLHGDGNDAAHFYINKCADSPDEFGSFPWDGEIKEKQ